MTNNAQQPSSAFTCSFRFTSCLILSLGSSPVISCLGASCLSECRADRADGVAPPRLAPVPSSRGAHDGPALAPSSATHRSRLGRSDEQPMRRAHSVRVGPTSEERTAQRTVRHDPHRRVRRDWRGTLLSLTPLGRQSRAEIIAEAQKRGPGRRAPLGTASPPTASPTARSPPAAVPPPRPACWRSPSAPATAHLPPVIHAHGTLAYRGYAPSVAEGPDRAVSVLYASAGRAAIAPDYLGLGTSPGRHPYMDARSAASASLDMLRAAHSAAPKLGTTLERTVSVTGFSQGGQVGHGTGPRAGPRR